jgi:hypothetical protein
MSWLPGSFSENQPKTVCAGQSGRAGLKAKTSRAVAPTHAAKT